MTKKLLIISLFVFSPAFIALAQNQASGHLVGQKYQKACENRLGRSLAKLYGQKDPLFSITEGCDAAIPKDDDGKYTFKLPDNIQCGGGERIVARVVNISNQGSNYGAHKLCVLQIQKKDGTKESIVHRFFPDPEDEERDIEVEEITRTDNEGKQVTAYSSIVPNTTFNGRRGRAKGDGLNYDAVNADGDVIASNISRKNYIECISKRPLCATLKDAEGTGGKKPAAGTGVNRTQR